MGGLTTLRISACSDLQALFAERPNSETDKKQQDRTAEREQELTSIATIRAKTDESRPISRTSPDKKW
jgi:hypothetical protein